MPVVIRHLVEFPDVLLQAEMHVEHDMPSLSAYLFGLFSGGLAPFFTEHDFHASNVRPDQVGINPEDIGYLSSAGPGSPARDKWPDADMHFNAEAVGASLKSKGKQIASVNRESGHRRVPEVSSCVVLECV